MSNEELYNAARAAILELFGDISVSQDQAKSNLEALLDEINKYTPRRLTRSEMETVPVRLSEPPEFLFAEPIGECLWCFSYIYPDNVCEHGDCHIECCEEMQL